METVMAIVKFISEHGLELISGLVAVLTGLIAICMVIPGEQPEKFLQSVVDFLAKFSKK